MINNTFSRLINKPKGINCIIFRTFTNKPLLLFFKFNFQFSKRMKYKFQIYILLFHNSIIYLIHFSVAISAIKRLRAVLTFVLVAQFRPSLFKAQARSLAYSTLTVVNVLHRRTFTHVLAIVVVMVSGFHCCSRVGETQVLIGSCWAEWQVCVIHACYAGCSCSIDALSILSLFCFLCCVNYFIIFTLLRRQLICLSNFEIHSLSVIIASSTVRRQLRQI